MRYAGIIKNDVVNGKDVSVSFWCQGCPHHCNGCHNPETWDFNGGLFSGKETLIENIISAIGENGIQRNLSILGGEPLCKENKEFVVELIKKVKKNFPDIKIYVWTGYQFKDIDADILKYIDVIIDGKFILEQKDITLPLRGSRNQNIIDVQKTIEVGDIVCLS